MTKTEERASSSENTIESLTVTDSILYDEYGRQSAYHRMVTETGESEGKQIGEIIIVDSGATVDFSVLAIEKDQLLRMAQGLDAVATVDGSVTMIRAVFNDITVTTLMQTESWRRDIVYNAVDDVRGYEEKSRTKRDEDEDGDLSDEDWDKVWTEVTASKQGYDVLGRLLKSRTRTHRYGEKEAQVLDGLTFSDGQDHSGDMSASVWMAVWRGETVTVTAGVTVQGAFSTGTVELDETKTVKKWDTEYDPADRIKEYREESSQSTDALYNETWVFNIERDEESREKSSVSVTHQDGNEAGQIFSGISSSDGVERTLYDLSVEEAEALMESGTLQLTSTITLTAEYEAVTFEIDTWSTKQKETFEYNGAGGAVVSREVSCTDADDQARTQIVLNMEYDTKRRVVSSFTGSYNEGLSLHNASYVYRRETLYDELDQVWAYREDSANNYSNVKVETVRGGQETKEGRTYSYEEWRRRSGTDGAAALDTWSRTSRKMTGYNDFGQALDYLEEGWGGRGRGPDRNRA